MALSDDSPLPEGLAEDLAAIARVDVVPTILDVVCRATGMGFAAVARVTEDRWIACAVKDDIAFGLAPGGELKVRTTICNEIRGHGEAVVIDHVAEDPNFCGHPTPAMYGFQSYISVPIFRPGGEFFGTLCAIDPRPARLDRPETVGMFKLFAELIGFHLDAQERLRASEAALLDARQTAELRDQFIAVLGHDLRSPLASIDAGTRLLGKQPLDEKGRSVLELMRASSARMAALVGDVLDFARGQLGGGIPVALDPAAPVAQAIAQVVAEARSAHPARDIAAELAIEEPVRCDAARIAQLLSNLLANALSHGDPAGEVRVGAATAAGGFELWVANAGTPIPANTAQRLFKPFTRASGSGGAGLGLGLGLYIAAQIARGHGGTLDLASDEEETRFSFRMPLDSP